MERQYRKREDYSEWKCVSRVVGVGKVGVRVGVRAGQVHPYTHTSYVLSHLPGGHEVVRQGLGHVLVLHCALGVEQRGPGEDMTLEGVKHTFRVNREGLNTHFRCRKRG
jgi:hypothetical protein